MRRSSPNAPASGPGNALSLIWVCSAAAMAPGLAHHAFHFIDEPEAYMRNVGQQFHGMAWLHVGAAHCLLLDIAQHCAKLFRSIVVNRLLSPGMGRRSSGPLARGFGCLSGGCTLRL